MALTYIETVRLLMGDLDEGDNNAFTGDQWAHLFESLSYEDSEGDSKVSLLDVAIAALRTISVYHVDSRPERSKAVNDRASQLSRWHKDVRDSYVVDGSESPNYIPINAVDVHNMADDSHADLRAAIDAAVAGEGVDLSNYATNTALGAETTAREAADVAEATARAQGDTANDAALTAHEATTHGGDVDGPIAAHDAAAPSHGAIRAKAQTTEDGLASHIANHPGGGGDDVAGSGDVRMLQQTGPENLYTFPEITNGGQVRELFNSTIQIPAGNDDAVFMIEAETSQGSFHIPLTKRYLEELTAVTPVDYTNVANGHTASNAVNCHLYPLGQNRGLFIGLGDNDPPTLQWGFSHEEVTGSMQIGLLTAQGEQGPPGPGGGGTPLSAEALAPFLKDFAEQGSIVPPLATDIALDPHDGYLANTTYEIGQNIAGGVRRPQWVPRPPSSASFFISLTTRPTPAQIAPGGWVASGGHVLVTPDDGPEEIWARYLVVSDLVKVATFADHIIRPGDDGMLPSAADNVGRVGLAGNHFYRSVGEQGHNKVVTFKDYGPTRVVLAGEPAKSANELLYAGSVGQPPHSTIGDYVVNTIFWDWGSEVWILKASADATQWATYSGPLGYHTGSLYQTEGDAAVHVANASNIGHVFIIGHSVNQRPKIITGYTAPTAPSAEWVPIGLTIQDIAEQVDAHNSGAASHQDLRGEHNGFNARLDTLEASGGDTITGPQIVALLAALTGDARLSHSDLKNNPNLNTLIADISTNANGLNALLLDVENLAAAALQIMPYSATNTYQRGGRRSIVTHADGLFIYVSSVERSANHDPGLFPGYWLRLSEGVAYEVITQGAHRIAARTIIVNGDNDRVYLCTTTQTTPRDLAYIHAQAQSVGGAFIWLNPPAPTDANPLGLNAQESFREFSPGGVGTDWQEGQLARGTENPHSGWYIVNQDFQQPQGIDPSTDDDFSRLLFFKKLTQAQYDALDSGDVNPNVLYAIVG